MVGGVREDAERCAQARGGHREGAQLRLGRNAGVNASRPHASDVTGLPQCSQRSPEVAVFRVRRLPAPLHLKVARGNHRRRRDDYRVEVARALDVKPPFCKGWTAPSWSSVARPFVIAVSSRESPPHATAKAGATLARSFWGSPT